MNPQDAFYCNFFHYWTKFCEFFNYGQISPQRFYATRLLNLLS